MDLKSSRVRSATGNHEHGIDEGECAQFTRAGSHDLALFNYNIATMKSSGSTRLLSVARLDVRCDQVRSTVHDVYL